MPKFQTSKHPGLILQDEKGIWAQFKGGEFETSDAAAVKRLRTLPEDYEVTEVKASAKSDDKGDGDSDGDK